MAKAKTEKKKTEKRDCVEHKWIPLLGVDGKKTIKTFLFTCVNCGDLKVGTQTIKISRFRMDMGELPINNVAAIRLMNAPTVDETASGLIINAYIGSNSQGIGAPLYMESNGHFHATDADSTTTSPCVALAVDSGTGAGKRILVHGILRVDAWNWTVGPGTASLIYISTGTGTLTQTQPSGTDDVIQPVGWALTSDCIYFSPSMIYLTHV